jgi:type I restriction enzyme S subunit
MKSAAIHPPLKPKLRFPEFRDGPGWDEKPMGEVYSFKGNNSLSRDKLNYEEGTVKNIHYGDIHTKFSTLFDVTKEPVPYINPSESLDGLRAENDCTEGDMVFADASEDLEDIGKSIELVRLNGERVVSGLHTILARPAPGKLALGFGAYLFKSKRVRVQIQKESQGAKVLGISATRLTKIQLPIPSTIAEQQKIAECLSTLDELIGAERQKLDTLKAHKKGLMQHLFPCEGEPLPRLRFPEFHSAPEWKMKSLADIAEISSGTTPPRANPENFIGGTVPWVKTTDLNNSLITQTEECLTPLAKARINPAGSVLVAMYGGFNQIGRTGCLRVPAATNQAISVLVIDHAAASPTYVLAWLNAKVEMWKRIASSSRKDPNITGSDVAKFPISVPSLAEQHRIATCLGALDELIAAQSDRLSALQSHKQGLLQQLFPSPAEADV